jgi:hypothetical protein
MQSSFLGKLQRNAYFSLAGALITLLGVPLIQLLVLDTQGYSTALNTAQTALAWIQGHVSLFLLYRIVLLLGFALLLSLPFSLFRIIIAQEIVGRAELDENDEETEDDEVGEDGENGEVDKKNATDTKASDRPPLEANGMPAYAWRGKGFAVIAAWTSLLGLVLLVSGTLMSTIYLWSSSSIVSVQSPLPSNYSTVTSLFALLTYTGGIGLLALGCLFNGIVIARSGRRLWPDSWVGFAYSGLLVGAILSGSAVQVLLNPTGGQASLTTPAILLFGLWAVWYSVMVVRLKGE